jgi:hypothetical protein
MLHTCWGAEAWAQVRVEFRRRWRSEVRSDAIQRRCRGRPRLDWRAHAARRWCAPWRSARLPPATLHRGAHADLPIVAVTGDITAARLVANLRRPVPLANVEEMKVAFAKLRKSAMDGVLTVQSPVFDGRAEELGRLAGLVAYAPDILALWRRAATYVDRILRGAKPADLPVEQPRPSRPSP